MNNYENKVAVITGGTSGLGYAFAELLGKAGAKIVITGRREELGFKAEAALKEMGIDVMYVQQDVTDEADWDNLLKTVIGTYGRIDYAFNNAGVMARPKPGMNLTMKDWDWVLDTNIHGTLYGLRKFTGAMMMQPDGGHIITTASTASIAPFSMWGPYSVSKAAVLRLVETFKGEMLPEQFKSMQNEQGLTDQAIFDFAFYAKKLQAQGVDTGASRLQNMTQKA